MGVTPKFVLEAGRGRQRALAGAGGIGGLGGPDSGRRSAPLLHRGSSGEVVCPTVGVAADSREFLQDIPGRGGERAREEAVEREREEAVERLSGRDGGSWDGRQSGGWGGHGCVSGNLIMGILKVLFKEPDLVLHSGY